MKPSPSADELATSTPGNVDIPTDAPPHTRKSDDDNDDDSEYQSMRESRACLRGGGQSDVAVGAQHGRASYGSFAGNVLQMQREHLREAALQCMRLRSTGSICTHDPS
ncbi:uncharacterized protein RCC_07733 [Ramularia collo-cygni]|uniref:Uncharacterized protein n=1 Tax=Ramularia collo-cygni TaxID=112498 RepID=A0A2D3VDI9_9PEZI|nr:uncharacterized protein RCC_07733 [Ramularia collo-cygni]CZT21866.1 uncharacterized protein RCC_07733 [Ramularia collo-cygni]